MITPTIRLQLDSRLVDIRVITRAFLGILSRWRYAAFFAALTFAQRARCAAAILLLPAADMVRLAGADPVDFATSVGRDCFRTLAHRAFCASAIFRRESADMIRFAWCVFPGAPAPFKDSIPEIICSNLSIST